MRFHQTAVTSFVYPGPQKTDGSGAPMGLLNAHVRKMIETGDIQIESKLKMKPS